VTGNRGLQALAAALTALATAAAAFFAGLNTAAQGDALAHVKGVEIREVVPAVPTAKGPRSYIVRVTFDAEAGAVLREVPVKMETSPQ